VKIHVRTQRRCPLESGSVELTGTTPVREKLDDVRPTV
jgi:hypothetical protein